MFLFARVVGGHLPFLIEWKVRRMVDGHLPPNCSCLWVDSGVIISHFCLRGWWSCHRYSFLINKFVLFEWVDGMATSDYSYFVLWLGTGVPALCSFSLLLLCLFNGWRMATFVLFGCPVEWPPPTSFEWISTFRIVLKGNGFSLLCEDLPIGFPLNMLLEYFVF